MYYGASSLSLGARVATCELATSPNLPHCLKFLGFPARKSIVRKSLTALFPFLKHFFFPCPAKRGTKRCCCVQNVRNFSKFRHIWTRTYKIPISLLPTHTRSVPIKLENIVVLRRKQNCAKKRAKLLCSWKKTYQNTLKFRTKLCFSDCQSGRCGMCYTFASWGWGFKKPLPEITV